MTRPIHHILFCVAMLCSGMLNAQQQKLFTNLPSSYTGVNFRNDIAEDQTMYYYLYEYLYNGGGVAAGDINNDGLPDLYFTSTRGSNQLFLNLGNCKFKDISADAGIDGGPGIKTGVNMIDINNDGWLDIYVCRSGPFDAQYRKKMLYINNHNNTFTESAHAFGLDDDSYSTQSYFFDYDLDGDLDLFLTNHTSDFTSANLVNGTYVNGKLTMIADTNRRYVSNRLYENRKGHFYDVSPKAGVMNNAFGLSACIFDFNEDGWPDVYVCNDFNMPDFLYINNKNGTFSEHMKDYMGHISLSSMGSDISDINNDGREDLLVLDMAIEDPVRQKQLYVQNQNYDKFHLMNSLGMYYQYPHNVLQLNMGDQHFSEIAYHAGVAQTDWSWSALIGDFDNDGWKDIYVANGMKRDITDWDYKEFVLDSVKNVFAKGKTVDLNEWFKQIPQVRVKNYFYRNSHSLHFDNYTSQWTDQPASFSNGAAMVDLDNDGDLDIVVNNVDDEAFIMRNDLEKISPQHYLRFKILRSRGEPQEVYGATVKLKDEKNNMQLQRYDPQRGFLSGMEHALHFGLGTQTYAAGAEILFPGKKYIAMNNVPADQVITLYESDAKPYSELSIGHAAFKDVTAQKKFSYTQKENDFIDFKREPLIPYKCSRKGPYYAQADVNADGRADLFIGGASGAEGKLFMQNADGSFTEKKQAAFAADKLMEDNGTAFFDADGDGDKDLYVVSGGAEWEAGNIRYQDRLYINDGKGNFTRSLKALPKEMNNGSSVSALDFDGDGDEDLFIGGGVTPGQFPKHDKSMLLQNNKGVFTDVTAKLAPALAHSGIVNAAAWGDINGDGKKELLIAGEWMPVMVLYWDGSTFSETIELFTVKNTAGQTITTSNSNLSGWWNAISLADIDKDGDLDILLGNRGQNSKITATYDEPCKVYAKDFDNNGSYDAVLGYYIQGKCYPMYHRDQLIDQMPFMRKKFYRYRLYAGKTMDEIFTEEQKKGMDTYTANCFESGVMINDGNDHFHFSPFPELAQLSNICDMQVTDYNNDGIPDIITCGNSSDADVSTGFYDAMSIQLLKGNGDGSFTAVPMNESGLNSKGEVRKLVPLNDAKRSMILLRNNAPAKIFGLY